MFWKTVALRGAYYMPTPQDMLTLNAVLWIAKAKRMNVLNGVVNISNQRKKHHYVWIAKLQQICAHMIIMIWNVQRFFSCIAFLEENKWSIFTGFHKEDKIRRSRVGHLDYFLGKRPNICATKWWRRQITLRLHKDIGRVFNLHTQCLRQR